MGNKIWIHGYLGRDPEMKEYKNAKGETGQICTISVGSSEQNGETEWFNVKWFGRRAEVVDKFFSKGSQIDLWGRMTSSTSEKSGQKIKYWNVIGDSFEFCDSKGNGSTSAPKQTETTEEQWTEQEGSIPF